MSAADTLQPLLDRVQIRTALVGSVGILASVGALVVWPDAFYQAYLVSYLFWVGIALGCMSLLFLHNLTGGMWGLLIRRPLEAGAMTIIPLGILFVPIVLGIKTLYPWARPEVIAEHPLVRKAGYLTEAAFLTRAVGAFAIWIVLASLLRIGAMRRSADGTTRRAGWISTISGPGLGLVFFTGSFMAIDWAMSLEPEWYSTIYGVMLIVGWGLLTFASMILVTSVLSRAEPIGRFAKPSRIQDLGNLMLAFVMLWAYMSFSQFLIIWCGNLVEEIPWYLRRLQGGWEYVALALIIFHFFVPFFALLFREVKRKIGWVMFVAVLVVLMHLVNLTWLVLPAQYEPLATGSRIPWRQLALIPVTWLGLGGISGSAFVWMLKRRPLASTELIEADAVAHEHALDEHADDHEGSVL